MEVQVEYEYVAQEPDELTLRKGDIITNVVQKLDGWWEGNLGPKRGLFPDNFVKVVGTESQSVKDEEVFTETVQLRKKPSHRKLKALFSYSPEQDDELTLEVGDVVDFLSEVEDGWWKGSLNGRTGIFPSNFVEDLGTPTTNGTSTEAKQNDKNRATYIKGPLDSPSPDTLNTDEEPAPKLPPKPVRELARCFYPYAAQNEDELELQEGDIVTIISKNCEDEGWWRGELRGKNGLFPDNFVKIIPPSELHSSTNTTKITAQAGDIPIPSMKKELPPQATETTDGGVGSKNKDSVIKKLAPTREPPTGLPPPKPITPTSPLSPANLGFSLPSINLKSTGKKDLLIKKDQLSSPGDEATSEFLSEFNVVERNEKQLNHLTAKRAKAPKRRPPSTLLSRESENDENGLGASPTSPVGSPHNSNSFTQNHNGVSPVGNISSNSSASATILTDGSNLTTPGSRLSQSREMENSASMSSFNSSGNATPTSITPQPAKPKVLPWMLELKQNQEKKRMATSPNPPSTTSSPVSGNINIPTGVNNSTTSSSSPTGVFTSTPVLKSREREPLTNLPPAVPAKAPPLPAKPVIPVEKTFPAPTSANISHSTTTPTNTSTVSTVSMKFNRKAPATTAVNSNYVNTVITTTSNAKPTVANNTSNNHAAPHTNNVSKTNSSTDGFQNATINKGVGNNPDVVPYEEYAKLKDRVHLLENELDVVKKQLKLLLDRDMSKGHIV